MVTRTRSPRAMIVFTLVLATTGGCIPSKQQQDANTPATAEPLPLGKVKFWAYQIQGLDAPGAVDALAASRYDLLVLEPTRTDWSSSGTRDFGTKAMTTRLKAGAGSDGVYRKRVIAYINIGEAEDWRWYWKWSTSWTSGQARPADWPSYILVQDPDGWAGDYPVAYWQPAWKDLVIYGNNQDSAPHGDYASILDEVIRDGFDGVYLDWVEGYEDDDVAAAAKKAGLDPAAEMIKFISEIREYARQRYPGFLVIQQNAAALIDGRPELLASIDGIAQEAVWFDGEASDDWNDPGGHDLASDASLTADYISYLDRYLNAGVPVFNCEYALGKASNAYAQSLAKGYVAYCTRISLGRLTTTPPPGY
ncbi:MAG: endo alpha-1,4 polygalactosaminidase [Phycisphaerae bacterium]|nr:endo alpha-1,4 polygalactosaminidase [Phycisphaerae bacterium]